MASLTLRVITPDRIVLDTTADSVRLPGIDGSMGVLARHAPMVTALDSGELDFTSGGKTEAMFVSGGFAEVRDNTVRVVTEAGERAGEIDVERARASEARARERISTVRGGDRESVDLMRAEAALRRSLMRLRIRETR